MNTLIFLFRKIGILRSVGSAQISPQAISDLETPHGQTEELECYFSPRGNCQAEIIQELDQAKNQIDAMIYTFTAKELAETLINAKERGCIIRVYLDKSMQKSKYSQAKTLEQAGIPVKFDNHAGLMHNKFAVIDGKTLITGSYNWTKQAENKNDENLMIIHNEECTKLYADKFEEYWQATA